MDRRAFLRTTGTALGACIGGGLEGAGGGIAIVGDPSAMSAPAGWAIEELRGSLARRGASVEVHDALDRVRGGIHCVIVAPPRSQLASRILKDAGVTVPAGTESFAIVPGSLPGRSALLITAGGPTGFVYGLLELCDRIESGENPETALRASAPAVEKPANRIRCISRAFCSDLEDKPWYNDREMWPEYFKLLLKSRFNRFNLTLGLAYDVMRNVTDCYFHFAYPFLVSVPGYDVRAVGLPDDERDRNLEALRYISDCAAARGLQFQLGVWDHAYEWIDSPKPNYTHTGITPANHGPYCRDALKMILQKCPGITGVTIRVHGESGVAEGSYDFWKTLFDGVAGCGRKVEIDLHAKGIDDRMIAMAVDTGLPVVVAPKYWAEHMGLPYHQAGIRELERAPREGPNNPGLFSLSNGERRFTRYGYADLMKENRKYGVLFRMFPGARRVLLWGDPLTAAGYGRVSSFCGADGVDFMEPLYFKGRRGSGVAGSRCSYADASLDPHWDWQKFEYTYRVWGRHLYNPAPDPGGWRRYTKKHFGTAASDAEEALGQATRVLQIVSTIHGVSGAHNRYWPEIYTNMSIVDTEAYNPYPDTPAPKRFGTVSPFDPQLFLTIDETADELVAGTSGAKYSQIEAASWLEQCAAKAKLSLEAAEKKISGTPAVEFRRLAIDTKIQEGLGRFFAAKIRSAVLWRVYQRSGYRPALDEALRLYRAARGAWAEIVDVTRPVYLSNVSYGHEKFLSGHWSDRLPAIDEDIARMARQSEAPPPVPVRQVEPGRMAELVKTALRNPRRPTLACKHKPAAKFTPGAPLDVSIEMSAQARVTALTLFYRHANQSETWEQSDMNRQGAVFSASIPASYTKTEYPMLYYFVIREAPDRTALYPGIGPELVSQPYFAVRQI
jgi:hypothetical protein